MKLATRNWKLAACLSLMGLSAAQAGDTYVNATVGGVLSPGVYGRIDFGNAPPPPVLYPQPVIIQRPAVLVHQEPLYLYVPPGHAKKWSKHCASYNACGRPVYFVKVDERHHDGDHKHKHKHKGHGKHGHDD